MRNTVRWLLSSLFAIFLLSNSHLISHAQDPPPLSLTEFLALVEDPHRDSWQEPDAVMEALGLQKGQRIAEIGAWSGYFTLRLAQAVGPTGHVTALELEEEVLSYLRQRVERDGLSNVTTEQLVVTDTRLGTSLYDLIFMCNFYHHLHHQSERMDFLRILSQALKPTGRLIILDFFDTARMPVGPAIHMRLNREAVQAELKATGFVIAQTFTFLPYQYIVIARQPTESSQLNETEGDVSGPHP